MYTHHKIFHIQYLLDFLILISILFSGIYISASEVVKPKTNVVPEQTKKSVVERTSVKKLCEGASVSEVDTIRKLVQRWEDASRKPPQAGPR